MKQIYCSVQKFHTFGKRSLLLSTICDKYGNNNETIFNKEELIALINNITEKIFSKEELMALTNNMNK